MIRQALCCPERIYYAIDLCRDCYITFSKNVKHKESPTSHNRKHRTGFSREEYLEKLEEQDFRCAICFVHESNLSRALHADHNHLTLDKRGLLCNTCNAGLGLFLDDKYRLQQAIDYLDSYEDKE